MPIILRSLRQQRGCNIALSHIPIIAKRLASSKVSTSSLVDDLVSRKIRGETATASRHQGRVVEVHYDIVVAAGLESAKLGELVTFESNQKSKGVVLSLRHNSVSIGLLSRQKIAEGSTVITTGKKICFPASLDQIGKLLTIEGKDSASPTDCVLTDHEEMPMLFAPPPSLNMVRKKISKLMTGLKAVDTLSPIGYGVRTCVLAPSELEATTFGLEMMTNISHFEEPLASTSSIHCIYVLSGCSRAKLSRATQHLHRQRNTQNHTIIFAGSDDTVTSRYLAPYAACALGEYLRKQGKHALVLFDDIASHVQLSGDLHNLLGEQTTRHSCTGPSIYGSYLERAGAFNDAYGGGSLTLLSLCPLDTTQVPAQATLLEIAAMHDSIIKLDQKLALHKITPPIDCTAPDAVSRSMPYQDPTTRGAVNKLRPLLRQLQESAAHVEIAQDFGILPEFEALAKLQEKSKIQALFSQTPGKHASRVEMLVSVMLATNGMLDYVPSDPSQVQSFLFSCLTYIDTVDSSLFAAISGMNDEVPDSLLKRLDEGMRHFCEAHGLNEEDW